MFNTVFVSPVVWSELSCDEDFLSLLQKIPRDDLLVVIELFLEDDAAEEDGLLVCSHEVLREVEACECLVLVRSHVGCKSAGNLDVVVRIHFD